MDSFCQVSIWINFPFTGNSKHYTIDSSFTYDDLGEMIMNEFDLDLDYFDILSANQQITDKNFKLSDGITFNIIPKLKAGRPIKKSRQETFCRMIILNKNKEETYNYISPNYSKDYSKHIRNYDKDELENIGKKYKIAMEKEYETMKKTEKENEKSHQKLKDVLEKIRSSKNKKKGIVEKKKNVYDTFCGFKKGFLL